MNIMKKFNNLKLAAKRVFVGLLVVCLVCTVTGIGSIFAYADDPPEHTHEYQDGTCTVCGAADPNYIDPNHAHDYQNGTCTICGAADPNYVDPNHAHDYQNGTCTICGEADPNYVDPNHTHDYQNGTCTICGEADPNYIDPNHTHNYQDGTCTICGAAEPTNNTTHTEHEYRYTSNNDGTHSITCTGCDYTGSADCSFGTPVDNGDGTQTKTCTYCGYTVTESSTQTHVHNYETWTYDGFNSHYSDCTICNERCTEECELTEISQNDADTHYKSCPKCGRRETEAHEFEYRNNGDNTHSEVCRVCGYVKEGSTQACTPDENGVCTVCHYDPNARRGLRLLGAAPPPTFYDFIEGGTSGITLKQNPTYTGNLLQLYDDPTFKTVDGYELSGVTQYITSNNGIDPGSTTFTIKAVATKTSDGTVINLESDPYTVTILQRNISDVEFEANGLQYTLKYNGNNLVASTDYNVVFSGTTFNAGDTITITYTGLGKYTGTVNKTVTADVTVLYDGDSTLRSGYYYSVAIRASEGYKVKPSDNSSSYASEYVINSTGTNQSKSLVFFDENVTNIEISKIVSGINIYENPSFTIKYNGAEQKDWYNDDVKITAEGYVVSNSSSGGFNNSYTFIAESNGNIGKALYFKNSSGTTTTYVSLNFDKELPAGTIKGGDIDSSSFNPDNNTISFNVIPNINMTCTDSVSGAGPISYFVSDTLYASKEALVTAAKDSWITYATGSSIALTKDKKNYIYAKLTDVAGNENFVSTSALAYDATAPVVTTINTSKLTNSAQVTIEGTDALSGVNTFYVLAKEKVAGLTEPSQTEIKTSGLAIPASPADGTTYTGTGIIQSLDPNKSYVFYTIAEDKAGNISPVKSRDGYAQEITIDIRYNGAPLKEWYTGDVAITCDGYSVGDKGANNFLPQYTISGHGTYTRTLDFKNTATGVIKTYDITVRIDKGAPVGVITSQDYKSDTFKTKDEVAFYTNGSRNIIISSSDDLSGILAVNYYAGDKYYSSPSDVITAMNNAKATFSTYSAGASVSLNADKNNYLYAKITDRAGNETYLSTGKIIYDSKAPTMTGLTIGTGSDGNGTIVGVTGKDDLSGINRFKLMYFEKADGMRNTPPSKDEIFNNGIYIETKIAQDGEYGATYTLPSDFDSSKTYTFYAAAVDRAGNISDITSKEGGAAASTTPAASAAAGAAGAAGAGSKSGLAPAPSGIAGSGNTTGSGAKGGNGTTQTTGTSGSSTKSPLDREINRMPYISDATGSTKIGLAETGGWENIISEIKKADLNATIEIEMSGLSEIPESILSTIAGRPVTVVFQMPQDVKWIVKGENVSPGFASTMNLGVDTGNKSIPQDVLDDVTGTNPHYEFEIYHEGSFGFDATIVFPVGDSNKGLYANLYHYNPSDNDFALEGTTIVTPDGYAQFDLNHASSFSVVVTSIPLLTERTEVVVNADLSLTNSDALESTDAALRIPDLFGLKGQVRLYLFIIAIICAVLCVSILFMPGLQLPKKPEDSIFDQFDLDRFKLK